MFNEINMINLRGADAVKYSLNLAETIFGERGLARGVILEHNRLTDRDALDQDNVNLIRGS